MKKVTHISQRKSDHIRINLREDVQSALTTGLENYRFEHQALPECNLEEVDTQTVFLNKPLAAPILISSMTGGSAEAAQINLTLAEAAEQTQIAMGLGSQRAAIEHPEYEYTFQVRKVAPNILLFANLGAIQLNYRYGIDECKKAVDMIEADALILHLNPLQEALQPEGDTRFENLIDKIALVCRSLPVPVVVKEVGWGISQRVARLLIEAGVAVIDVAGAGGTSWSQVEMYRAQSESAARIASHFIDWGIPTSECILNVRAVHPTIPLIASGGLRNGIDIAKCLALGANLGAMASPFLKAAARSLNDTIETIHEIQREIQITMFAAGVKTIAELQNLTLKEI
ncbi:MAG: type 2 isopentenyl-diphosphate Delta-isomerase [Anaerolineae bacterium]|jgi:isopentenyl-diphosphate delta-isomerase|nr:MAG: type 2 isopentenyl-diphosphate Delta-isomerase [Anaerolineae bacterium]